MWWQRGGQGEEPSEMAAPGTGNPAEVVWMGRGSLLERGAAAQGSTKQRQQHRQWHPTHTHTLDEWL